MARKCTNSRVSLRYQVPTRHTIWPSLDHCRMLTVAPTELEMSAYSTFPDAAASSTVGLTPSWNLPAVHKGRSVTPRTVVPLVQLDGAQSNQFL